MEIATVVSGKAIDFAAGKLMENLVKRFQSDVIQKWTKQRAQKFFETFCEEIGKETALYKNDNADALLEMILEDEKHSEVLFDSYRRVCMARSKDMGPRIIGLLTAQLISKGIQAGNDEEQIFMAAEQMMDDELVAFAEFYEQYEKEAQDEKKKETARFNKAGGLEILWSEDQISSSSPSSETPSGPLNLIECIGSWALKLKLLGMLSDDIKERQRDYANDYRSNQEGIVRYISWWIYISASGAQFKELILRSTRA